ncbi:hypothetical protein [Oharaeibacter diazotrophicus]|uniref:Uncharacterized protein n=1 Tax=Oharaeibacter diazotrophicus TaxID=1920512 RepID=A0A4R6RAU7_9HYPH|nr:hypothetical protein [Oharaeibacter diazotrophicus]TDP83261.1 hypothetical protein EDD54_3220 [Oharaeibacter diazotrophicus]BBE72094.1 hypothetical protein OHA_1_01681 [Pleomorphomonas sp. SM30]GLS78859.1 hypothetical protein GCM10007904_41960 [Oharaeibacter diazotrophicus]
MSSISSSTGAGARPTYQRPVRDDTRTEARQAEERGRAESTRAERTETVRAEAESRAADDRRREEAPKVESTPRTPGSGVQLTNDMLVFLQSG